jgi:hypothetical protein
MRGSTVVGGVAAMLFGLAGLASAALQLAQPALGFEDTDDPAVSLAYLRDHADNYVQQGLALFVLAIALTLLVFAMWDLLASRTSSLGLRTVSSFGLLAALCFFLFGVFRYSVRPLLYIDGLDQGWGESAYLVQQIAGIHGFAQASILASCGWAVGVAVMGYRARALPRWLGLLAILPATRLLSGTGPLLPPDALPDWTWIVFMLAIPGAFLWFLALGLVLLRRGLRTSPTSSAPDLAPA